MRPDINPGEGELAVLLVVAVIAWAVWAWVQFRDRREP